MKFELTIQEVNLVLSALGRLPYEAVFELVEKVRKQATQQVSAEQSTPQNS